MADKLKEIVQSLFSIEPHERIKVFLLTTAYFCMVAGYTVAKELKDTVFTAVVGSYYIPPARIASMIFLVPAILFYSLLVDRIRRYQLLCFYSIFFGVAGLIFTFLLSHPIIGMANTAQDPYRIFGWLFYFFLEGFTPFVVGVFWAFSNSITNQESAKKNYGLMVAGSKVGGMFGAVLAIVVLLISRLGTKSLAKTILNHQILLCFFSIMCIAIPFIILFLMKKVPGQYLHGYEAVYQLEKKRSREEKEKTGVFAGFAMLLKYPYVFGIFAIVFFYEIINSVLSYHRVRIAEMHATTISEGDFSSSEMALYLFIVVFFVHFVGFIISFFSTRAILEALGEKWVLLLIPVLNIGLLVYLFISYDPMAFMVVSVLAKSLNYALGYPVRERLYIPTPKEVKFKAKSWIDAFGGKFGKTSGSTFNWFVQKVAETASFGLHFAFFAVISVFWLIAAFFLGRQFEWAVSHNAIIGVNSQGKSQSKDQVKN